MLLVYVAVAWAAGIAISSLIPFLAEVWALWLILPAGLFLVWWSDPTLRRIHFCLFVFLLAALRYVTALPHFDDRSLAAWNDRGPRAIVGDVVEPVQVKDRVANMRLAATRVQGDRGWQEVSGLALLQVPRETDIRYGDRVQVYGEPATPAEFEDFSYKDYLARQGIHSVIRSYGNVTLLARDQGDPFRTALYAFRGRALTTIYAIFPEPAGSLLAGILVGDDSGMPRDLQDAFQATNTAHIIAISGFNIGILAGVLSTLMRRIPGKRRATLIIAGLVLYTLLVGASPSVVRATIMASLTVVAVSFYRQNEALNALAIAALVMSAQNPQVVFDPSFQLSFLATLGLILYTEPLTRGFQLLLEQWVTGERAKQVVGALSDSLIVTVAAQITTLPLILFSFHRLSLVGLITNLLVLPVQPAVEIFGGAATLVAMAVQPVGQVLAWIAWAFLEWTIAIVRATAALPLASVEIGRFDLPLLVLAYALILGLTLVDWDKWRRLIGIRPAVALGMSVVACVWVWNYALTAPDGKTHVEFLDAEGPATFVRTPRGTKALIDGGANPSVLLSVLGERMPFWDRSLDLVVLTSAEDDHLAGLVAALERYDVGRILQVKAPDKPTAAHVKWQALASQKPKAILAAQEGLRVDLDRGVALVIHEGEGSDNTVARLQAGSLAILFAESSAPEEQTALVNSVPDLASTVLVTPRKVEPEFVEAVDPQFGVLFTDDTARSAPSADLLAALSGVTLLQTGERGTIEFVVDGTRVRARTEK